MPKIVIDSKEGQRVGLIYWDSDRLIISQSNVRLFSLSVLADNLKDIFKEAGFDVTDLRTNAGKRRGD